MQRRRGKVIAVSGGFDPLHIGHVRLFEEAKKIGEELVIILNNDNWLLKKKGYVFMPQKDRKEIIEALGVVDRVVLSSHPKNPKDMSVVKEIGKLKPDIVANGGDRDLADAHRADSSLSPERILCEKLGIRMEFGLGRGGKIRSSSQLLASYKSKQKKYSVGDN